MRFNLSLEGKPRIPFPAVPWKSMSTILLVLAVSAACLLVGLIAAGAMKMLLTGTPFQ